VTPHGASRVTRRRDGLYFVPDANAFADSGLQPDVLSDDADSADRIVVEAAQRGIAVHGWSVFFHNEALGAVHPEVTQENCFGDRAGLADLCPANPSVRRYAVELAEAVAALGVRSVIAESLHFGAFGHGYHHERSFVALGPIEQLLLGLCFCEHCTERAQAHGVNVEAARTRAAQLVDAQLSGGERCASELTMDSLARNAGADIVAFALARCETVTTLVADVAAALAARGIRLCFLDLTGAMQGYGDGTPGPQSGLDDAWQLGIDPAAISQHADLGISAYARDASRVRSETVRYRSALAESCQLRVLLRPGQPDCDEVDNLTQKVAGAYAVGAASIDFYHYGLFPLPVLERIHEALVAAGLAAKARSAR
jgi:hypothetical protein